jgi:hypothetical protein
MKTISIRVRHGREELIVWLPRLQLQAYTTKVELVSAEGVSDYTRQISTNRRRIKGVDELVRNQREFIDSLKNVADEHVLSDGTVVYTVRKMSDVSGIDFSAVIGEIPRPVYFVNEDKDLIAIWFDGRFIDDENSVEFQRFLSGFARTRFSA